MAYAALVSLARTVDEILNHDGDSISCDQRNRVLPIHGHVVFMQAFLEKISEKVDTDLEGKIRNVSTEAEDVIEYFMWKKQYESCYGPWPHHDHDLDELNGVANKFDSIVEGVMNIMNCSMRHIETTGDSRAAGSATSSSRLAPSHTKEAMVGFQDDLLAIKERLCGESSKLQVIPIVGMGGLGKTTLANNAYHDPLITEHFHIRAWVTVSQDYSAQKVFSELLNSMKELNTERSDQSDEEKVYKILKGRKYLIVMDDMWSTQAWDDVKRIFPDDGNGSRIMLTTRLSDVAAYADSSGPLHKMHLMNNDQSWNLLRQRVFAHEELCTLELENIGKGIARSCGGLPLAIAVIEGLLSTSIIRASWKKIAYNLKLGISFREYGQIEKVLSLSYTHLPHYLRSCFLYIGAFPEDYEIKVSKLIRLWVAEGFLKNPNGSKSYKEVAEEYLEDLVKRSLVLVKRSKSNGKIKSCSVHDLVWDLCIREANEVRLFCPSRNIDMKSMYQRRICVGLKLPYYGENSAEITDTSVCNFRSCILLRMLDVSHSVPAEVFQLFRLRYLVFRSDKEIPADISNLQNLQTLIINHPNERLFSRYDQPRDLVHLPKEIWKMRQLRHLILPAMSSSCTVSRRKHKYLCSRTPGNT